MKTIAITTGILTLAKAEFIKQESEKSLQRTLDDRDAIQRKGIFILGGLSAIIAYGTNRFLEGLDHWPVLFLSCLGIELLALIALSIVIVWTYLPSIYAGHGYDPKNLLISEYLKQDVERMLVGYAHELQHRIDLNRDSNQRTAIRLKRITSAALLSPVLVLIVLFVFR